MISAKIQQERPGNISPFLAQVAAILDAHFKDSTTDIAYWRPSGRDYNFILQIKYATTGGIEDMIQLRFPDNNTNRIISVRWKWDPTQGGYQAQVSRPAVKITPENLERLLPGGAQTATNTSKGSLIA